MFCLKNQDFRDYNQLKKILNDAVEKRPNAYIRFLRSQLGESFIELEKEIIERTQSALPAHISLKTRIYFIINGLKDAPYCHNRKCRASLRDREIKSIKYGYPHHCCFQCAKDSDERKLAYEKTCEKKYGKGIKNASQSNEVKKKKQETSQLHYGTDNPAQSLEVKAHMMLTCQKNFGVDYAFQAPVVKNKIRESFIRDYGVESYSQTDEYNDKVRAKNRENFGVDYPMQDPEFRKSAQKKYQYNGINFDSSLEIAFYIWHLDNSDEIIAHPSISFEYSYNGIAHKYQPDFEVNEKLFEIKGLHFFKGKDKNSQMINPFDRSQDELYEAKHKCMLRNGVTVLTDVDCKKYVKYVEITYGKDFLKKCKRVR